MSVRHRQASRRNITRSDGSTFSYQVKCDKYLIDTVITCSPTIVDNWIRSICHRNRNYLSIIIGLDVGWKSYKKGKKPETLQLCRGTDCLIIQLEPFRCHMLQSTLMAFVANEKFVFSGYDIKGHIDRLENCYCLKFHRSICDLKKIPDKSMEIGILSDFSYTIKDFAIQLGSKDFGKDWHLKRSDWTKDNLTNEQIAYAACFAFASYYIAVNFRPDVKVPHKKRSTST